MNTYKLKVSTWKKSTLSILINEDFMIGIMRRLVKRKTTAYVKGLLISMEIQV